MGRPVPSFRPVSLPKVALCALVLVLALAVRAAPAAGQDYPPPVELPAAQPPPAVEPPPAAPGADVVLSNESTRTRWAHALQIAPIRLAPRRAARSVARLRFFTEDGYQEVYLVLARHIDSTGAAWLKVRIPMRPNGRTGWVAAEVLGALTLVRTQLVVDRSRLRATLYRSGRPIWSSPVGIGAPATPTPTGRFWIRERLRLGSPDGLYGPLAFGTAAYSRLSEWPGGGVIGIHGTNEPQLIPGRPSHGCIRVPNRRILQLARLMPIGTPVLIK